MAKTSYGRQTHRRGPRNLAQPIGAFGFNGRAIKHYPAYCFGCYMRGLADLKFEKEMVFAVISDYSLFVKLYNDAAEENIS